MTIAESIAQWLKKYDEMEISEVSIDKLDTEANSYGMLKGNVNNFTQFSDGTKLFTQYFYFVIRKFSQTESERADNQAWLQGLEKFIDDKNENNELPILEDGYSCEQVLVNNSYYVYSTGEEDTIYQLTLAVDFKNF